MAGVEHVTPGGQCMLYFGRLDRTAAIVFAHEMGHMQFGSGDEYPYGKDDPQDDCDCIMGRGCFNGQYELCIGKGHTYREKESCWDNLKRWYPNLVKVEKAVKGPALKRLPETDFKN
jgi:M6 family metalloprotease-like protein